MDLLYYLSLLFIFSIHLVGLWLCRKITLLLSPIAIILLISLFKVVPYSYLSYVFPEIIGIGVRQSIGARSITELITEFNLLYGVFIACFIAAFMFFGGRYEQRKFIELGKQWLRLYSKPSLNIIITLSVLSAILFGVKLQVIGGLSATIIGDNLDRYTISKGIGYIVAPADLLISITTLLAIIRYNDSRRKVDFCIFISLFLFSVFSLSLGGGRKALLQHIIILLAFWCLAGGRIHYFSFRFLVVISFSIAYFLLLLQLRMGGNEGNLVLRNYRDFGVFGYFMTFISNFSYNDTYYFLIDYFSASPVYMGRTFIDLLYAPLPSGIFPDKPPIDEGLYVKALASWVYVAPPVPASAFVGLGSWPPETFGNFIMNFGVYSVWMGGLLYGFCIYLIMRIARYVGISLITIYIVYFSALNFQISNLRLVNLITIVVFGTIIVLIINFINMMFYRKNFNH